MTKFDKEVEERRARILAQEKDKKDAQGHLGTGSVEGVCLDEPEQDTEGHLGTGLAEGVSLAQVLDEVAGFNQRFIYHKNSHVHDVVALWVLHTYAMDKWNITPRLYINAPQAGAGKSTQGKVIQYLSSNGIKVASATPAYIFAKVSEHKGAVTLLLDEADNIWSKGRDTSELQALINEGYEYGATVGRGNATDAGIVGNDYQAFCPVVIIGVKNSMIPTTTLSRCIDIKMTLPDDPARLERFIVRKHLDDCAYLRAAIQEVVAVIPDYEEMDPPEGLALRAWDIWEPLFILAKEAGGDWPERVLRAAQVMNDVEVTLSPAQKVLGLALDYLRETGKAKPHDIAEHINSQDEMFALDGQRVSYYLKTYDVASKKSNGERVFALEDVSLAARQWLPAHPSPEPSLPVPGVPEPEPMTALDDEWLTAKEMAGGEW